MKQKLTFSIRKVQLTEPTLSCTHLQPVIMLISVDNDEWEHSSEECSNKAREIPRIVSPISICICASRSKINWMLNSADAYKARFLSAYLSETGAHLQRRPKLAQQHPVEMNSLFFWTCSHSQIGLERYRSWQHWTETDPSFSQFFVHDPPRERAVSYSFEKASSALGEMRSFVCFFLEMHMSII